WDGPQCTSRLCRGPIGRRPRSMAHARPLVSPGVRKEGGEEYRFSNDHRNLRVNFPTPLHTRVFSRPLHHQVQDLLTVFRVRQNVTFENFGIILAGFAHLDEHELIFELLPDVLNAHRESPIPWNYTQCGKREKVAASERALRGEGHALPGMW